MFKKIHYPTLMILALVACFTLPVIAKNNIIKFAFAQTEKKDANKNSRLKITQDLKKGDFDSVIRLSDDYLKSNPNDIAVINLLTEAYLNKGDLPMAETTVKKALEIQPHDPWSCKLSAQIYKSKVEKDPSARSENLVLALEQIENGLALDPNNIMLLAEKSRIYALQGDNDKASQTINKAIEIAPDDAYLKETKESIIKISESARNKR